VLRISKNRFLVFTITSSYPDANAHASLSSVKARKWPCPRQSRLVPPIGLAGADLVDHLVRDRHDVGGVGRQGRFGHEQQVLPALEPPNDFGGGLLAGELAEEFFDVLNF
jgi:hypothetical protein